MLSSARDALNSLLTQCHCSLDDEVLNTLMAEVKSTVNSRPLTYVDDFCGRNGTTIPKPVAKVVLLADETSARPKSPREIVEKTFKSDDKLVRKVGLNQRQIC